MQSKIGHVIVYGSNHQKVTVRRVRRALTLNERSLCHEQDKPKAGPGEGVDLNL